MSDRRYRLAERPGTLLAFIAVAQTPVVRATRIGLPGA
jgi:hypothetical protein